MQSLNFNYRSNPTDFEMGAASRTASRGMMGAVGGAIAGAGAGFLLGLSGGPLAIAGAILGGIIGAASGFKSSDTDKVQNRPIQIDHPLWGQQKVYISADQWKDIKTKLDEGVKYDEFNSSALRKQFEAAEPPAAEKA